MVIKKIKEALEKRRQRKAEEIIEQNKLESYRENEQLQKAEQIKKEADRLAHLKQYKTAIDEYNKALEIYPFDEKETMFKKPAEFFFKLYYNIAASYSFLNKFDDSIECFDKALEIENIDDENRVKALMSKGNCYYRAKQLVKGDYEGGAYTIRMESDFDVDDKTMELFRKLDEKEGLFEKLNAQNEELTYQNASIETQKQDLIRARDLIEAQKHELIEKNKELEQHIDEKTRDLIKTNKELIQYNNELRQFSYTISHNLRAPVASLIGLANIIGYDNLNDDDKLIVNHIKKSAENLDIVFKDLNKIIDIRSSLAVVKEKIVLSKEINEIKSSLKNEIKNSNIIFEDNLEIDIVFSIRPFINSILYNLISNAIKFKSRRRSLVIKISSKQEEENVIITVEDNGIGMDLETFKDDIFKMYKRFNQHTQGKGLGLYLVKLQAESLGGEIQVTSVLNKGTRFSLVLKNVTDLQDQTVLENEYARVFYDAFSNAAGIIWKREVSSEEYREMFIKNLEIFRSYKTPFWISDMRNVGPVSAEDQQWLIESIIPEAMEYGLKKIAMVIKPENIDERQKVYMEKLLQIFKANGVESSFFIDMEKGRNWLLN